MKKTKRNSPEPHGATVSEAGSARDSGLGSKAFTITTAKQPQNNLGSTNPAPAIHTENFEDAGIIFTDEVRSVYDLEKTKNAYGRDIYVEEWQEYTGKPKIWYEFNKQGFLTKSVRSLIGITATYLGKTEYID